MNFSSSLARGVRRSALLAATALGGAGVAAAAAAATSEPIAIKPGLWEMTTRMQASDPATKQAMASAQAQIAAMPPEQRRQLEKALAGRGVDVRISAEALTARICITREMADRNAIGPQSVGNCQSEPSVRSGNTVRFAAICSQPRSTTEGATTFTSDTSFESKTKTTIEQGKNSRMSTVEQSGRWIGADCGAVAPKQTAR